MSHRWQIFEQRVRTLVSSPRPWLFVLGALAIGLMTEGFSKLIDSLFTIDPIARIGWTTLAAGIILLLILALGFDIVRITRETARSLFRQPQPTLSTDPHVPHHRGLIAFVSYGRGASSAHDAIAHHSWAGVPGSNPVLEHCFLIAGPGEGELASLTMAGNLDQEFEPLGIDVSVWSLEESDDIQEVYDTVRHIYQVARQRDGLDTADIIADYTGGTKSMTAGMVLAVIAEGGEMQYMKPNAYEPDGRVKFDQGSRPCLVNAAFVDVVDQPADHP